jgi:hypothetical protein
MATTFTQKQCTALLRPIFQLALPQSNVQCNLPRALVHGSLHARGLNIPDLNWLQLVQHLQTVLRHMHRDILSRDLHEENMNLRVMQFCIEYSVTFWELPFQEYGNLAPDGWMKNTWEALSKTALTLKGPNLGLRHERHSTHERICRTRI